MVPAGFTLAKHSCHGIVPWAVLCQPQHVFSYTPLAVHNLPSGVYGGGSSQPPILMIHLPQWSRGPQAHDYPLDPCIPSTRKHGIQDGCIESQEGPIGKLQVLIFPQ